MPHRQGMTLVEMMVSMMMFSTLLWTLLSAFTTGQQTYWTNEGVIRANEVTRGALEEMNDDLVQAKIISHLSVPSAVINGMGKTFVVFQRLEMVPTGPLNLPPLVTPSGEPVWEAPWRMYLWCDTGALALPPCNNVVDQDGVTAAPPTRGELLLLRSDAGIVGPWKRDRSITTYMDFKTAPNSPFIINMWERHTGAPLADNNAFLPHIVGRTQLFLSTVGSTPNGRNYSENRRATFFLRNPQS